MGNVRECLACSGCVRGNEISWDIRHLTQNNRFWPVFEFFFGAYSRIYLNLVLNIYIYIIYLVYFSRWALIPLVFAVTNMAVSSKKRVFSLAITINAKGPYKRRWTKPNNRLCSVREKREWSIYTNAGYSYAWQRPAINRIENENESTVEVEHQHWYTVQLR